MTDNFFDVGVPDHPAQEQFFDVDLGPQRDKWGRPMLIPRGGNEGDRRAYSRMSGLADALEDNTFLEKWERRGLAKGLADSMDLIRLAAAENYTCGFAEDPKANSRAGKNIDDVIVRALDRAGCDAKADYGTAVHARTEPGNQGTDPDDKQRVEVESFWAIVKDAGISILGTEVFTANDHINGAGTFDHLMYIPRYGICITDKKTSSKPKSTYDIQLGGYANADCYDYADDTRMTLEEYVASLGWDPNLINRKDGFLFWIKNGKTQIRHLDLAQGWEDAQMAAKILAGHRKKGVAKDVTGEIVKQATMMRESLLESIVKATNLGNLNALWNPEHQPYWTPEHIAAAKKRKAELTDA